MSNRIGLHAYRHIFVSKKHRMFEIMCLLCVKTVIPDGVASSLDETGRALDELERTIAKMMNEAGVDQ